jgi:hypothetical protein
MNVITYKSSMVGVLALVCSAALGQESKTIRKEVASPKTQYSYYLHVEVTDGVDMDQVWSSFSDCLRGLQYGFMRGRYVEGEGTGNSEDAIPSGGSIDEKGTDAIIGPFKSKKELEAASDNVKECLSSAGHKLKVGPFGHWIIYFKLKK